MTFDCPPDPTRSNPVQLKNFKGSVATLPGLPLNAEVGDGYYVKALDTLVIRVTEGWLLKFEFNEDEAP